MVMGRDPEWQRVARIVRDRRESIGITQDAPGGPSKATWYKVENAIDPPYALRTTRAISRVLGWSPDSIERILIGEEPVVVGKSSTSWGGTESLEERIARLEAEMDERMSRIEAEMDAVNALVAKERGEPVELPLSVRQAVDHLMGLEDLREETKQDLDRLSKSLPPQEEAAG